MLNPLQIAGSLLILAGILSLQPVLGSHLLPAEFSDFPGNVVAAIASLVAIGTGLSMVFWRTRIAVLGISGKETWARAFLLTLPILLLVSAEGVLIAADKLDEPVGADDLKARKMMKANWGKQRYKDVPLVAPTRSTVFNVNRDGFRTYELDTPRTSEHRILLLGGSTGFGWGVADAHTIGSNLERMLTRKTGKTVKVFNLSVPAVAFDTENLMLRDFGAEVSADVVVFYHGANDGLAWFEQTVGRADARQTLAPSIFSREALLHYAYKSRVFRLAVEAFTPPSPGDTGPDIDVSKAVEVYDSDFRESQRLCMSTKCLYVIQPILFNKRPRTTREVKIHRRASALFPFYEQMYDKYTDALINRGFANHVDARGVFEGSSEDIFLDYVHVSPRGNEMIARFIVEALCTGKYVPCRDLQE